MRRMVKFSREYEASIIPEWKAAFVDYKCLKKLIKRIKIARREAPPPTTLLAAGSSTTGTYGFSVLDPVRALTARLAAASRAPAAASPVRVPSVTVLYTLPGERVAETIRRRR